MKLKLNLSLLSMFSSYASAQKLCTDIFEGQLGISFSNDQAHLYGRELNFTRLSTSDHSIAIDSQLIDPGAVYIGVNSKAHAYILTPVTKVDGNLLFSPTRYNAKDSSLEEGFVFKINNPTDETLERLAQSLDEFKSKNNFSCVDAACSYLKYADIETQTQGGRVLFATSFLKKIFTGKLKKNGESLDLDFIIVGDRNIQEMLSAISQREKHIAAATLIGYGQWLFVPTGIVLLYLYINEEFDSDSAQD